MLIWSVKRLGRPDAAEVEADDCEVKVSGALVFWIGDPMIQGGRILTAFAPGQWETATLITRPAAGQPKGE